AADGPDALLPHGGDIALSRIAPIAATMLRSGENLAPDGRPPLSGLLAQHRKPHVSLRRDYLLRMIEQSARVLARVRELLVAGLTGEARAELEKAARGAGLDINLALSLSPDSLLPLLMTGGEVDRARCAFFAELLYLEWQRALADGDTARAKR